MDMMKAILDIEARAQEVEDSIDSLKAKIKLETDEKIKQMQSEADAEAEAEIAAAKDKIDKEKQAEIEAVKAEMKLVSDSLEKNFTKNRNRWIEEITQRIITEG